MSKQLQSLIRLVSGINLLASFYTSGGFSIIALSKKCINTAVHAHMHV